jgi:uncharacterized protein (TIGR03085 family)
MTTLAQRERASLCHTLLAVGPAAPTLCEGWLARDLAAHLVIREHSALAAAGIWGGPLASYTGRRQDEIAGQPWDTLVAQVGARPAIWHPARWASGIEALFDDAELFIHHEDVRRGDGVARPRELSTADQEALWKALTGTGRLAYRKSPVGIVVAVPGRGRVQLHKGRAGTREVTLHGAVGELLLASFGRGRAAVIDIDGRPEDVALLKSAALGL